MKKLLLLFVGISFTFSLTNCSGEESHEEQTQTTSQKILGEWTQVGVVEDDEEFYFEDYEGDASDICIIMYNFYSQGRLERKLCNNYTDNAVYTILEVNKVELILDSGYSGKDTVIATIYELNENKMIIGWSKGSFTTIKIFNK